MPGSSPALLGKQDIETLGVLTINDKTIGRQLASGDSADKRQRNYQCERAVETEGVKLESYAYNMQGVDAQKAVKAEGGKPESCTNKKQDANVQRQCNADNKAKPNVIFNLSVMASNNNENSCPSEPINKDKNSFFSELIINENQFSFRAIKEKIVRWQMSNKQARKTITIVKVLFHIKLKILTQM